MSISEFNNDADAQNTLVTLLRQERNDAISSLASAKAELEIAREDLDVVLRKRRNKSPSPSRTTTLFSGGATGATSGTATPLTYSNNPTQQRQQPFQTHHRNIDDAVQDVLNAARQRAAAAMAIARPSASSGAVSNGASPLHGSTTVHQQQTSITPSRNNGSASSSTAASRKDNNNSSSYHSPSQHHHQSSGGGGRRLDDELATHIELAHRQIGELERRIERYETDVQTALTRNEELQLRLDASLLRERALSERTSMLEEENTEYRFQSSEQEAALEALKVETAKLMMKLNVQLERDAQLESRVDGLDLDNRRYADESARLRGANEAYQQKIADLETDIAATKVSNDRREEDLRQKVILLSRELASVREQRDQALRPYHARQGAAAAASSPMSAGGGSSSSARSPLAANNFAASLSSNTGGGGGGMASPPSSFYRASPSNASPSYLLSYPQQHSSPSTTTLGNTDDVHELKRQVQWLLQRSQ